MSLLQFWKGFNIVEVEDKEQRHTSVFTLRNPDKTAIFMAGSCTAEANKTKPDGERLRQL